MTPRTPIARLLVYTLLIAGSIIFLFPFFWLLCTSLKPIEQTMKMPPAWVPRAYYATLDSKRLEVTKDMEIKNPSVMVVPSAGPHAGKKILVSATEFDTAASSIKTRVLEAGLPQEKLV